MLTGDRFEILQQTDLILMAFESNRARRHYTRPWSFVRTFSWGPDFALQSEYNCEEQVGDKSNTNSTAGFVPEPED